MSDFLQALIDATRLGSLYAMLALGVALIFGIMRLLNFAYGDLLMIGGYAMFLTGQPVAMAVAVTLVVVIGVALAMDRIAFRPVRGASATTLLVTSFAVSFLIQNLAILIFGSRAKSFTLTPWLTESFMMGDVTIAWLTVITIAATAILVGGLVVFLSRTTLGTHMRAAAEDFGMARLCGVRANIVIAVAFSISGLLAGVASLLLVSQTGTITPTMGVTPVILAFVATVVGGMGSLQGSVLGGFLLGTLTVVLEQLLPPELRAYRDAFLFSAVMIVLIVRPKGLLVPRSATVRV